MSLLATNLRERKKVSLYRAAPSPLRLEKKKSVPQLKGDVFDLGDEIGHWVIEYIDKAIRKLENFNVGFMLNMPTVNAYQSEVELVKAIKRCESVESAVIVLKDVISLYIETHTDRGDIGTEWTDKDIPLFYFTVCVPGEDEDTESNTCNYTESYTCNYIQVYIIRNFWRRLNPECTYELIRLC